MPTTAQRYRREAGGPKGRPLGSAVLTRSARDGQDVVLGHDQVFLAVDRDFAARVAREQHAIALLHLEGRALAVLEHLAFAGGQHFTLLWFLLGCVRQHDAAGGLLSGLAARAQAFGVHRNDGPFLGSPNARFSGGSSTVPYTRPRALRTVVRTTCGFTGFGTTLNTWAWNACRINSRVASAVIRIAGRKALICRTSCSVSSPVNRGICISSSAR